jgi:transposase
MTTPPLEAPPPDWKEGRRLRALELHEPGWTGREIAAALGVSRGAVSQWRKAARTGGRAARRRRPRGRKAPPLTPEQRAKRPEVLAKGAEADGFIGDVWTTARVAAVIRRELGVRHHPAHGSRILRAIGGTVQQPMTRSTTRDAAAVTAFREERAPALRGKPGTRTARSSTSTSRGSTGFRSGRGRPRPVGRRR